MDIPLVSIVTICKGRLHHLKRTLPNMLVQKCDFRFEVVVVDFGCPQGTYDWCRSLDVNSLVVLKVLGNVDRFHVSRARNCGARIAQGDVLAFVDADVFLDDNWLAYVTRQIVVRGTGLCSIAPGTGACWGTCAVTAEIFHAVRGYDEALCGWSMEDQDFYVRCGRQTKQSRYNGHFATPIQHDDSERVKYQDDKDLNSSCARNIERARQRTGIINPLGYGLGQMIIYRGQGEVLPPITWRKRERIRPPLRRAPREVQAIL